VFFYRLMAKQLAIGLAQILCGRRTEIFGAICNKAHLSVSSRNVRRSEAAMKSSTQFEGGVSSIYILEGLQNSMCLKVMREIE
jgi:hypothetical protein